MDWRPIGSAPTDGTVVETFGCLHDDGGVDMGEQPSVQVSYVKDGKWFSDEWGTHYPVYWRPHPETDDE